MAITVNIYYRGENGNARRFAEEMMKSGVVGAIRSRKGNIRYEYFYPADDDNTVLLIDSWENQSALDEHHASEVMDTIISLREKYDLHMTVERYLADDGNNEADEKFIRK